MKYKIPKFKAWNIILKMIVLITMNLTWFLLSSFYATRGLYWSLKFKYLPIIIVSFHYMYSHYLKGCQRNDFVFVNPGTELNTSKSNNALSSIKTSWNHSYNVTKALIFLCPFTGLVIDQQIEFMEHIFVLMWLDV